jgi:hypothetical protein
MRHWDNPRHLHASIGLSLLIALSGCGGSADLPEIARVTGTVTRNGKPVPNLMVNFMPEAGRPSWGKTDENGHYEMVYDEDNKGVKVGRGKIYVLSSQVTIDAGSSKKSKAALAEGSGISPADMRVILQKYGREDTTPLTYEIKKDPDVIEIKLD